VASEKYINTVMCPLSIPTAEEWNLFTRI